MSEALSQSAGMIAIGSSSFSFASRFLPRHARESAFLLYGWCRYCDDQIDLAPDASARRARLQLLRRQLEQAQDPGVPDSSLPLAFQALREASRRHQIPAVYAQDLLVGMQMDQEGTRYESLRELRHYAYCVAGSVGVMMAYAMGVSRPEAIDNAVDLGIAMQLTNIARDIREDAREGRVYLPLDWLRAKGMTEESLRTGEPRAQIRALTEELLHAADAHYERGNRGLRYLPLTCAVAISVASQVYREIGSVIRERGEDGWGSRAYVPFWRKCRVAVIALFKIAGLVPARLCRPWRPRPLDPNWRYLP